MSPVVVLARSVPYWRGCSFAVGAVRAQLRSLTTGFCDLVMASKYVAAAAAVAAGVLLLWRISRRIDGRTIWGQSK